MAFALTAFEAFPIATEGPQPRRAVQRIVFHATGLAADIDLDVGEYAGTFWTAALADVTTGELATAVLAEVQRIVAQADYRTGLYTESIEDARVRASTAGAGVYSLDFTNKLPNYLFNAANALLTYKIVVDFQLSVNILPVVVNYGIGG